MKKYVIFFILIFSSINYISALQEKVLVLPFLNISDDTGIDYISEVIPNSFNLLLEGVPDYSSVSYDELIEYMKANNLGIGDFYNRDTLMAIAEYFNVSNIVRGEYYEDDSYTPKRLEFSIEYIEIDHRGDRLDIIYNMEKGGRAGIYALDTLDIIVEAMLGDFIGVVMEFAYIEVNTDLPCELYIDNALMGVTPLERKKVSAGKHTVRVFYNGENLSGNICNETISLAKDEEKKLDLDVLVDFSVSSELECSLYLDNIFLGITPYRGKLLTGNEYNLKVTYEHELYSELVSEETINTKNSENIELYFPLTGGISVLTDNNPAYPLKISINNGPEKILPFAYSEMPLGNYDIEVYAYDPVHENKYVFYEENIYLDPGKNLELDLSHIKYRTKPGYVFVPALSQFYNRQPVKGRVLLITFITGVVTACLAPLVSHIYRKRVYEVMVKDYNENGTDSGYSRSDIDAAHENIDKILNSMLISGCSTAFSAYIYSLIDGAVNMRRLDRIFNPGE